MRLFFCDGLGGNDLQKSGEETRFQMRPMESWYVIWKFDTFWQPQRVLRRSPIRFRSTCSRHLYLGPFLSLAWWLPRTICTFKLGSFANSPVTLFTAFGTPFYFPFQRFATRPKRLHFLKQRKGFWIYCTFLKLKEPMRT